MKKLLTIPILIAVFLLTACSEKTYEPKEINAETDICKVCNMSIVHEDYAGQIILANGDYEVFDDIGCLIEFVEGMNKSEIGAGFIKNAKENKWLNVEKATYIYSKDYWTPMNYGVLAFDTKEAAEQFQVTEGGGELLTYEDLFDFEWGIHR